MELQELYKVQQGLKDHIAYKGEDKFSKMILAAMVEFMECANDWQGFKYWKKNNAPKTSEEVECSSCEGSGITLDRGDSSYYDCYICEGVGVSDTKINKLLEEYVDGLHFVLEIGLDLKEMGLINELPQEAQPYRRSFAIEEQYKQVVYVTLMIVRYSNSSPQMVAREYMCLLEDYLELGRLLGFNSEDIHKAYMEKNAENHNRQNRGY